MGRCRIGFDIGGTFTEFDGDTGQYQSVKFSSKPTDPLICAMTKEPQKNC